MRESLVIFRQSTRTMNGYAASTQYAEQLEAFRKSDAERDALVAQVLKDFEELKVQQCTSGKPT